MCVCCAQSYALCLHDERLEHEGRQDGHFERKQRALSEHTLLVAVAARASEASPAALSRT